VALNKIKWPVLCTPLLALAFLISCSTDEESGATLLVADATYSMVSTFSPHISGFEGYLGHTIHVFRSDGSYVTRFSLQRDGFSDLDITTDGNILVAVLDPEHSLWEYGTDGELIRKYGEPFVKVRLDPLEQRWVTRYLRANHAEISVLPDGKVVTLGTFWPRMRVYEDGALISEAELGLMPLAELGSAEGAASLRETLLEFGSNSPEAVNEAALAGTLTERYPGPPVMSLLMQMEPRGQELWLQLGRILCEVGLDGMMTRVMRLAPVDTLLIPNGLGFTNGQAVFVLPGDAALGYANVPW
jgi:hypothetical protein